MGGFRGSGGFLGLRVHGIWVGMPLGPVGGMRVNGKDNFVCILYGGAKVKCTLH